jgi:hypothetical protein
MTSPAQSLRFALILLWSVLAAALSGCMSMVGLGYGHADTVAAWKAGQYFDLDPDQERAFRTRFGDLYAWHRYEQLPEYVVFLRAGKQRLERGLTPQDVEWFTGGLKARYRLVVQRGAADAAELLATLTPQQIENLQRRWDKDNRKFAAEHRIDGTLEQRQRARAKRLLTQVRNWAGSLTAEQEARISALVHALPDTERMRLEDRMRRQREFVHLLDGRSGDRKEFTASLAHWLSDWERGRDREYARLSDAAWKQRVQLYVAVFHMLTHEQRSNVLQRLQGHISEFRRLSQSS